MTVLAVLPADPPPLAAAPRPPGRRTVPSRRPSLRLVGSGGESFPRLDGVRVLAVDDDVDARLITQQILEPLGARVLVASDGPEALRLVDRVIPDVILCDLLMPDMDGFEVARRLRRDPRTARLPIIAVTALDRDPDYYRTWEAGFDGHLSKPVDYAELAWIVRMLTRRRRGRRGGAWWGVGSAAGTRRVPRGRPASPPR